MRSRVDRTRAAWLRAIKAFAKSTLNPLLMPIAGRRLSPWGIMYHTGRRSGRNYAVVLIPAVRGRTFVFSITHGLTTDWYRNIVAAGGGYFKWQGRLLHLERPVTLGAERGLRAFNLPERTVLRIIGVKTFLAMRKSHEQGS